MKSNTVKPLKKRPKDDLTIPLLPGERAGLKSAKAAAGHAKTSLVGWMRLSAGLPVLPRGRPRNPS